MKFHDLFPEFYRDNERDWYHFIKEVFSPEFEIALKEIESLWNLIDIDTIPEDKLPLLADNLGFTLSDILPVSFRKQLANAIDLHKFKGTRFAVEKVLEVMGLPANLSEWFEYGGNPYRFKVEVSSPSRQITPELRNRLIQLINEYKNERSWLDELILSYLINAVSKSSAGCISETETDAETDKLFECKATETLKLNAGSIAEIAQNTKLSEFLANTDTFLKVYSAVAAETESFAIFEFQQEVVAPTSLKAFCVAELQSYAGGSL